jgi:hypothetical protein
MHEHELSIFPGGDLVAKGLEDLGRGIVSEEALLVLEAKPRLARLGLDIPRPTVSHEFYGHFLYEMLEERLPHGAHSAYNALIRRIVSFATAYSRVNPSAITMGNDAAAQNHHHPL